MSALVSFIQRDVIATVSHSVLTNEDSIKSGGGEVTIHIVILGVSDGWIRLKIPDESPENAFLPEIVDCPSTQICLPLTAFTRFELI